MLVDEIALAADAQLRSPEPNESSLVATCALALRNRIYSENSLRQIYGDDILSKARTFDISSAPSSRLTAHERADLVLRSARVEDEDACGRLQKKFVFGDDLVVTFGRVIASIVLVWLLSFAEFPRLAGAIDIFVSNSTIVQDAVFIFTLGAIAGTWFYFFYYFIIHRYFIRYWTQRLFGSPIYQGALEALRTSGVDTTGIKPSEIQDMVTKFFHFHKLRTRSRIIKSTVYHVAYMGVILLGVYGIAEKFSDSYAELGLRLAMFMAGLCFLMGIDRYFGEKEETDLIVGNVQQFVSFVKGTWSVGR